MGWDHTVHGGPSSVKRLWKHPSRHTQMIPNPVKLAAEEGVTCGFLVPSSAMATLTVGDRWREMVDHGKGGGIWAIVQKYKMLLSATCSCKVLYKDVLPGVGANVIL